jgi:hypothetical protein
MADPLPPPGSRRNADEDPEAAPGTPRWVVAFGIVAAILVLLFVGLHLAGGGFRGSG